MTWTAKETSRNLSFSDLLPGRSKTAEQPLPEEVMEPEYALVSSGDGVFYMCKDRSSLYSMVRSQLKTGIASASTPITVMDADSYKAAMIGSRSAQIIFSYAVPCADFCDFYGIHKVTNIDSIGDFVAIGFSEDQPESVYILNSAGAAFRLICDGRLKILDSLSTLELEPETYCYAGDVFGTKSMLPVALDMNSRKMIQFFTGEVYETEGVTSELPEQFAESIFGDTFDFVRRIEDNFGNITYMYSSGKKSMTVTPEYLFEYKSEGSEGAVGSFFDDLTAALSFVAGSGSWDSMDGKPVDFRLASALPTEKGHRFCFEENYCGGNSIIVELYCGKVNYYKRYVIVGFGSNANTEREAVNGVNILAANCNYVYNTIHGITLAADAEEALEYVVDHVYSLSTGHYCSKLENALLPAWILRMDTGEIFYFALYEGNPLGYAK